MPNNENPSSNSPQRAGPEDDEDTLQVAQSMFVRARRNGIVYGLGAISCFMLLGMPVAAERIYTIILSFGAGVLTYAFIYEWVDYYKAGEYIRHKSRYNQRS